MKAYFKNLNKKQLQEIFKNDKEIQKDIMGMIQLAEYKNCDHLGYFISECKDGVYSDSYYNEYGNVSQ